MKTKLLFGFLLIAIIVFFTNCFGGSSPDDLCPDGYTYDSGNCTPPEASIELEKRLQEENDYIVEEDDDNVEEDEK